MVTENIKVSIIIPVYNTQKYLRDCLYSAVNQTLRSIEIICVNDGSQDNSLEILKEYGNIDSRVIVFSQDNKGTSAARNAGLRLSKGEYIYFLDSDDSLELNALEVLYDEACINNLDILFFDGKVSFDSEIMYEKYKHKKDFYLRYDISNDIYDGITLFIEFTRKNMFHCIVPLQLISKKFLESVGLFFYEGIYHEDNLFTFQSMLQAKRVRHMNRVFFIRRYRENSIMTQEKGFAHFYGFLTCYIQASLFLSNYNHKIKDDTMKYFLRQIDVFRSNAICLYHSPKSIKQGWNNRITEYERYMLNSRFCSDRLIEKIKKGFRMTKQRGLLYVIRRIFKKSHW